MNRKKNSNTNPNPNPNPKIHAKKPQNNPSSEEAKVLASISIPTQPPKKPLLIELKSQGVYSLRGSYSVRPDKPNQDCGFVYDTPYGLVCGVADGHGHYGELVSGYISRSLLSLPLTNLASTYTTLHDRLSSQGIDTRFSGSTLSLAIFSPHRLVVSNVGDSHIILGSQGVSNSKKCKNNKGKEAWGTRLVSRIHNPSDREEAARIGKCGGRITWGDVSRVWLRNEEVPGLSMTRSIGDSVATQVGVISEPFVEEIELRAEDKWVAICSDGVTDVMDYQTIANTAGVFWKEDQAQMACERIVRKARKMWVDRDIDDITCVIVYFEVVEAREENGE